MSTSGTAASGGICLRIRWFCRKIQDFGPVMYKEAENDKIICLALCRKKWYTIMVYFQRGEL